METGIPLNAIYSRAGSYGILLMKLSPAVLIDSPGILKSQRSDKLYIPLSYSSGCIKRKHPLWADSLSLPLSLTNTHTHAHAHIPSLSRPGLSTRLQLNWTISGSPILGQWTVAWLISLPSCTMEWWTGAFSTHSPRMTSRNISRWGGEALISITFGNGDTIKLVWYTRSTTSPTSLFPSLSLSLSILPSLSLSLCS